MEHFKWKNSFNLGVEQIDRQHQIFVAYLNQLHQMVIGNTPVEQNQQVITKVIDRLKAYANFHFQTEEKQIQEAGLRDLLPAQVKQHQYFRDQLASLEKVCRNNNIRDIRRLVEFMQEWFVTHILAEDKKYAKHFWD